MSCSEESLDTMDDLCNKGYIENISDDTKSINSDYSDITNSFMNSIVINDINEYDINNDEVENINNIIDNSIDKPNKNNKIIPNKEQQELIDCMKDGNNIIVNAVAGSGKSTSILSAVKQMINKRFLLVTYNRDLASELKLKLNDDWWSSINDKKNIEIKTYHSYGKYYLNVCKNDLDIIKIYKESLLLKDDLFIIDGNKHFIDYVVIDEVQDINVDLQRFISKFICDIIKYQGFKPYLVLIGDINQSVYSFNGADHRFLECTKLWFPLYDGFIEKTLKVSFRVPHNVARYINEMVLGEQRIISNDTDSSRPSCFQYLINNFKDQNKFNDKKKLDILKFINEKSPVSIEDIKKESISELEKIQQNEDNDNKKLKLQGKSMIINSPNCPENYLSLCSICFALIKRWIEVENNKYEDIFILAPSVKPSGKKSKILSNGTESQSLQPITILQHFITNVLAARIRSEYPLYIPNNDNEMVSSDDVKGRIAITTFHQSKGRERKFVIILGYNYTYFKYFCKNECEYKCPPALYVALTRAKRELHLITHIDSNRTSPDKRLFIDEFKFLRKSCLSRSNYLHVTNEFFSDNSFKLRSSLKNKSPKNIEEDIKEGISLYELTKQQTKIIDKTFYILNEYEDKNNELESFLSNIDNIKCRMMSDEEIKNIKSKDIYKIDNFSYNNVTNLIKFISTPTMYRINKILTKIMSLESKIIHKINPSPKFKYQSNQGETLTDNISNYNSMCLT